MRRAFLALALCAAVVPAAAAQQPEPVLQLRLSERQVQLILQALPALQCGTLQALIVCHEGWDLLKEIQRQAKEQTR